jgi:molybdenum cofactor cytidylyltransferase
VTVTVVILAAGESKRFGSQKLLHRLSDNDTLLQRAIRASGGFSTVVVCSDVTLPVAQAQQVHAIVNREPERGMVHSLRLANDAIAADHAIMVLPADLLTIEPHHVSGLLALANGDDDVVFPIRGDGTPGHPVYFSPRARSLIGRLADNEPIARLRDNATLSRRTVAVDAPWPFRDVDEPADLA